LAATFPSRTVKTSTPPDPRDRLDIATTAEYRQVPGGAAADVHSADQGIVGKAVLPFRRGSEPDAAIGLHGSDSFAATESSPFSEWRPFARRRR